MSWQVGKTACVTGKVIVTFHRASEMQFSFFYILMQALWKAVCLSDRVVKWAFINYQP